MNFNEYQKLSKKTAIYPVVGKNFVYPTLGLAGETGELVEKVKKIFRDRQGKADQEVKNQITKELGDILWYMVQIATEFDLSLDKIASESIAKLSSRHLRGTLHGDGDDR